MYSVLKMEIIVFIILMYVILEICILKIILEKFFYLNLYMKSLQSTHAFIL